MDEVFFGGKKKGKRGRGSKNKMEVVIAIQLDGNGSHQHLKMHVIPDAKGETLSAFAEDNIVKGSTFQSGAFKSVIVSIDGAVGNQYLTICWSVVYGALL